jgi:hypothetical protein
MHSQVPFCRTCHKQYLDRPIRPGAVDEVIMADETFTADQISDCFSKGVSLRSSLPNHAGG